MQDFNLPGLFRKAFEMAKETGRVHVNIAVIIPECDKDEFIHTFSATRFIQQYSPIGRAAIPSQVQLGPNVCTPTFNLLIEAREDLETGNMLMEIL